MRKSLWGMKEATLQGLTDCNLTRMRLKEDSSLTVSLSLSPSVQLKTFFETADASFFL